MAAVPAVAAFCLPPSIVCQAFRLSPPKRQLEQVVGTLFRTVFAAGTLSSFRGAVRSTRQPGRAAIRAKSPRGLFLTNERGQRSGEAAPTNDASLTTGIA
jgi:hypothetical protein